MMNLWRKLEKKFKAAVAPKELFDDRIYVHTTNSGTQYVRVHDVFSDQEGMEEMRRVSATVREAQRQEDVASKNEEQPKESSGF